MGRVIRQQEKLTDELARNKGRNSNTVNAKKHQRRMEN